MPWYRQCRKQLLRFALALQGCGRGVGWLWGPVFPESLYLETRKWVSYIVTNTRDMNYAYIDIMSTGTKIQQAHQSHCMRCTSRAPVSNIYDRLIITMEENFLAWPGTTPLMGCPYYDKHFFPCDIHFGLLEWSAGLEPPSILSLQSSSISIEVQGYWKYPPSVQNKKTRPWPTRQKI